MNKPQLKLKEIIWEITGECKNGCKYCGSKEAWNDKTPQEIIKKICDNICMYPPEEIDISGGDPLLVPLSTHEYITKKLREKNAKVKILVNPKSLKNPDATKILKLYDWVGVSLNSTEDINFLVNSKLMIPDEVTFISNFNMSNIFEFDQIKNFAYLWKKLWMIQYTIYKDRDNELAIYNNESAMTYFFNLITETQKNMQIILSDNLVDNGCGAGTCSLGILNNGDVVPCLSMRSWVDNINNVIVGNIAWKEDWKANDDGYKHYSHNPLKYIWENRFNAYRFCEFECCKDACKRKNFFQIVKAETKSDLVSNPHVIDGQGGLVWIPPKEIKYPGVQPRVIMYAVGTGDHTYVYAVAIPGKFGTTTCDPISKDGNMNILGTGGVTDSKLT